LSAFAGFESSAGEAVAKAFMGKPIPRNVATNKAATKRLVA
jgi:hypothetical protein